jgi:hypothetical protein
MMSNHKVPTEQAYLALIRCYSNAGDLGILFI